MRIVGVDKLEPGQILGKSLFNNRGELLLTSGYSLNNEMINLVHTKGIRFVYIMDDITEGIVPEDVISDTVRQVTNQKLAETFENVQNNLAFETMAPDEIKKRIEERTQAKNLIKMPSIRKQVGQIIDDIVDNHVSMFTALPMKSDMGKDYEHAFDTTVLCILIAQEFRYDFRELKNLGTAAMIHDIGKMSFPQLLEKPQNQLTRDEKMILHEHPIYSTQILRGSSPDSFIEQTTVMQHHERFDGKGYPQALKGTPGPPVKAKKTSSRSIFRHAEILAVANAYDNFISGSLDGNPLSPAEALEEMINGASTAYNHHIVKALTNVIQTYPVGATVKIKQTASGSFIGYTAVIMEANEIDQSKPKVLLTHNAVGAQIVPKAVELDGERFVKLELAM